MFECYQDEKQKELDTVQKQLDEENARTELQLSVLNENLGTVRGDLVTAQQQVTELTKLSDELKGEKLGKRILKKAVLPFQTLQIEVCNCHTV